MFSRSNWYPNNHSLPCQEHLVAPASHQGLTRDHRIDRRVTCRTFVSVEEFSDSYACRWCAPTWSQNIALGLPMTTT